MGMDLSAGELSMATSWELISAYIHGDFEADPGLKPLLEAEIAARGLPLPAPTPKAAPLRDKPMSPGTFLDYLLLIYTATGLIYAWFYLPLRLIRGDFDKDRKHHLIQSAIALAYQGAEVGAYFLVTDLVG